MTPAFSELGILCDINYTTTENQIKEEKKDKTTKNKRHQLWDVFGQNSNPIHEGSILMT